MSIARLSREQRAQTYRIRQVCAGQCGLAEGRAGQGGTGEVRAGKLRTAAESVVEGRLARDQSGRQES
jgi:hypothetical protein